MASDDSDDFDPGAFQIEPVFSPDRNDAHFEQRDSELATIAIKTEPFSDEEETQSLDPEVYSESESNIGGWPVYSESEVIKDEPVSTAGSPEIISDQFQDFEEFEGSEAESSCIDELYCFEHIENTPDDLAIIETSPEKQSNPLFEHSYFQNVLQAKNEEQKKVDSETKPGNGTPDENSPAEECTAIPGNYKSPSFQTVASEEIPIDDSSLTSVYDEIVQSYPKESLYRSAFDENIFKSRARPSILRRSVSSTETRNSSTLRKTGSSKSVISEFKSERVEITEFNADLAADFTEEGVDIGNFDLDLIPTFTEDGMEITHIDLNSTPAFTEEVVSTLEEESTVGDTAGKASNVFSKTRRTQFKWKGGRRRKRRRRFLVATKKGAKFTFDNHVKGQVSNNDDVSLQPSASVASAVGKREIPSPQEFTDGLEDSVQKQQFLAGFQLAESHSASSLDNEPERSMSIAQRRAQKLGGLRSCVSRKADVSNCSSSSQFKLPADLDPHTFDSKSLLYDLKVHNESITNSKLAQSRLLLCNRCVKCGLNLNLKPRLLAQDLRKSRRDYFNCFFCCASFSKSAKTGFKSHLGSHILSFFFKCCNKDLGFNLSFDYDVHSVVEKYSSNSRRKNSWRTETQYDEENVPGDEFRCRNRFVSETSKSSLENRGSCHKDFDFDDGQVLFSDGEYSIENDSSYQDCVESENNLAVGDFDHYVPEISETFTLSANTWESDHHFSDGVSQASPERNEVQKSVGEVSPFNSSTNRSEAVNSHDEAREAEADLYEINAEKCVTSLENIDKSFTLVSDLKPRHFVKLNYDASQSDVPQMTRSRKILSCLSDQELREHRLRVRNGCARLPRVVLSRLSDETIAKYTESCCGVENEHSTNGLIIDAETWKHRVSRKLEKVESQYDEEAGNEPCSFQDCRKCGRNFIKHSKVDSLTRIGVLYPCSQCFFNFDVRHRFERHVKLAHPFSGPFVCHVCNLSCNRWFQFVFHIKLHDMNRYLCENCSIPVNKNVSACGWDSLILHAQRANYNFKEDIGAWTLKSTHKNFIKSECRPRVASPSMDVICQIIGVDPESDLATSSVLGTEEVKCSSTHRSNLKIRSIMESNQDELSYRKNYLSLTKRRGKRGKPFKFEKRKLNYANLLNSAAELNSWRTLVDPVSGTIEPVFLRSRSKECETSSVNSTPEKADSAQNASGESFNDSLLRQIEASIRALANHFKRPENQKDFDIFELYTSLGPSSKSSSIRGSSSQVNRTQKPYGTKLLERKRRRRRKKSKIPTKSGSVKKVGNGAINHGSKTEGTALNFEFNEHSGKSNDLDSLHLSPLFDFDDDNDSDNRYSLLDSLKHCKEILDKDVCEEAVDRPSAKRTHEPFGGTYLSDQQLDIFQNGECLINPSGSFMMQRNKLSLPSNSSSFYQTNPSLGSNYFPASTTVDSNSFVQNEFDSALQTLPESNSVPSSSTVCSNSCNLNGLYSFQQTNILPESNLSAVCLNSFDQNESYSSHPTDILCKSNALPASALDCSNIPYQNGLSCANQTNVSTELNSVPLSTAVCPINYNQNFSNPHQTDTLAESNLPGSLAHSNTLCQNESFNAGLAKTVDTITDELRNASLEPGGEEDSSFVGSAPLLFDCSVSNCDSESTHKSSESSEAVPIITQASEQAVDHGDDVTESPEDLQVRSKLAQVRNSTNKSLNSMPLDLVTQLSQQTTTIERKSSPSLLNACEDSFLLCSETQTSNSEPTSVEQPNSDTRVASTDIPQVSNFNCDFSDSAVDDCAKASTNLYSLESVSNDKVPVTNNFVPSSVSASLSPNLPSIDNNLLLSKNPERPKSTPNAFCLNIDPSCLNLSAGSEIVTTDPSNCVNNSQILARPKSTPNEASCSVPSGIRHPKIFSPKVLIRDHESVESTKLQNSPIEPSHSLDPSTKREEATVSPLSFKPLSKISDQDSSVCRNFDRSDDSGDETNFSGAESESSVGFHDDNSKMDGSSFVPKTSKLQVSETTEDFVERERPGVVISTPPPVEFSQVCSNPLNLPVFAEDSIDSSSNRPEKTDDTIATQLAVELRGNCTSNPLNLPDPAKDSLTMSEGIADIILTGPQLERTTSDCVNNAFNLPVSAEDSIDFSSNIRSEETGNTFSIQLSVELPVNRASNPLNLPAPAEDSSDFSPISTLERTSEIISMQPIERAPGDCANNPLTLSATAEDSVDLHSSFKPEEICKSKKLPIDRQHNPLNLPVPSEDDTDFEPSMRPEMITEIITTQPSVDYANNLLNSIPAEKRLDFSSSMKPTNSFSESSEVSFCVAENSTTLTSSVSDNVEPQQNSEFTRETNTVCAIGSSQTSNVIGEEHCATSFPGADSSERRFDGYFFGPGSLATPIFETWENVGQDQSRGVSPELLVTSFDNDESGPLNLTKPVPIYDAEFCQDKTSVKRHDLDAEWMVDERNHSAENSAEQISESFTNSELEQNQGETSVKLNCNHTSNPVNLSNSAEVTHDLAFSCQKSGDSHQSKQFPSNTSPNLKENARVSTSKEEQKSKLTKTESSDPEGSVDDIKNSNVETVQLKQKRSPRSKLKSKTGKSPGSDELSVALAEVSQTLSSLLSNVEQVTDTASMSIFPSTSASEEEPGYSRASFYSSDNYKTDDVKSKRNRSREGSPTIAFQSFDCDNSLDDCIGSIQKKPARGRRRQTFHSDSHTSSGSSSNLSKQLLKKLGNNSEQERSSSKAQSDTDSNYSLRLSAHPCRVFPSLKKPLKKRIFSGQPSSRVGIKSKTSDKLSRLSKSDQASGEIHGDLSKSNLSVGSPSQSPQNHPKSAGRRFLRGQNGRFAKVGQVRAKGGRWIKVIRNSSAKQRSSLSRKPSQQTTNLSGIKSACYMPAKESMCFGKVKSHNLLKGDRVKSLQVYDFDSSSECEKSEKLQPKVRCKQRGRGRSVEVSSNLTTGEDPPQVLHKQRRRVHSVEVSSDLNTGEDSPKVLHKQRRRGYSVEVSSDLNTGEDPPKVLLKQRRRVQSVEVSSDLNTEENPPKVLHKQRRRMRTVEIASNLNTGEDPPKALHKQRRRMHTVEVTSHLNTGEKPIISTSFSKELEESCSENGMTDTGDFLPKKTCGGNRSSSQTRTINRSECSNSIKPRRKRRKRLLFCIRKKSTVKNGSFGIENDDSESTKETSVLNGTESDPSNDFSDQSLVTRKRRRRRVYSSDLERSLRSRNSCQSTSDSASKIKPTDDLVPSSSGPEKIGTDIAAPPQENICNPEDCTTLEAETDSSKITQVGRSVKSKSMASAHSIPEILNSQNAPVSCGKQITRKRRRRLARKFCYRSLTNKYLHSAKSQNLSATVSEAESSPANHSETLNDEAANFNSAPVFSKEQDADSVVITSRNVVSEAERNNNRMKMWEVKSQKEMKSEPSSDTTSLVRKKRRKRNSKKLLLTTRKKRTVSVFKDSATPTAIQTTTNSEDASMSNSAPVFLEECEGTDLAVSNLGEKCVSNKNGEAVSHVRLKRRKRNSRKLLFTTRKIRTVPAVKNCAPLPSAVPNDNIPVNHKLNRDEDQFVGESKTQPHSDLKHSIASNQVKRKRRRLKKLRFCVQKKRKVPITRQKSQINSNLSIASTELEALTEALQDSSVENVDISSWSGNKEPSEEEKQKPQEFAASPPNISSCLKSKSDTVVSESGSNNDVINNVESSCPKSVTLKVPGSPESNLARAKSQRANRGNRLVEFCLMLRVPGLPRKPKHDAPEVISNSRPLNSVLNAKKSITKKMVPNRGPKPIARKSARFKNSSKIEKRRTLRKRQTLAPESVSDQTVGESNSQIDSSVDISSPRKKNLDMEPERSLPGLEVQSDCSSTTTDSKLRKKRRRKSFKRHFVIRKGEYSRYSKKFKQTNPASSDPSTSDLNPLPEKKKSVSEGEVPLSETEINENRTCNMATTADSHAISNPRKKRRRKSFKHNFVVRKGRYLKYSKKFRQSNSNLDDLSLETQNSDKESSLNSKKSSVDSNETVANTEKLSVFLEESSSNHKKSSVNSNESAANAEKSSVSRKESSLSGKKSSVKSNDSAANTDKFSVRRKESSVNGKPSSDNGEKSSSKSTVNGKKSSNIDESPINSEESSVNRKEPSFNCKESSVRSRKKSFNDKESSVNGEKSSFNHEESSVDSGESAVNDKGSSVDSKLNVAPSDSKIADSPLKTAFDVAESRKSVSMSFSSDSIYINPSNDRHKNLTILSNDELNTASSEETKCKTENSEDSNPKSQNFKEPPCGPSSKLKKSGQNKLNRVKEVERQAVSSSCDEGKELGSDFIDKADASQCKQPKFVEVLGSELNVFPSSSIDKKQKSAKSPCAAAKPQRRKSCTTRRNGLDVDKNLSKIINTTSNAQEMFAVDNADVKPKSDSSKTLSASEIGSTKKPKSRKINLEEKPESGTPAETSTGRKRKQKEKKFRKTLCRVTKSPKVHSNYPQTDTDSSLSSLDPTPMIRLDKNKIRTVGSPKTKSKEALKLFFSQNLPTLKPAFSEILVGANRQADKSATAGYTSIPGGGNSEGRELVSKTQIESSIAVEDNFPRAKTSEVPSETCSLLSWKRCSTSDPSVLQNDTKIGPRMELKHERKEIKDLKYSEQLSATLEFNDRYQMTLDSNKSTSAQVVSKNPSKTFSEEDKEKVLKLMSQKIDQVMGDNKPNSLFSDNKAVKSRLNSVSPRSKAIQKSPASKSICRKKSLDSANYKKSPLAQKVTNERQNECSKPSNAKKRNLFEGQNWNKSSSTFSENVKKHPLHPDVRSSGEFEDPKSSFTFQNYSTPQPTDFDSKFFDPKPKQTVLTAEFETPCKSNFNYSGGAVSYNAVPCSNQYYNNAQPQHSFVHARGQEFIRTSGFEMDFPTNYAQQNGYQTFYPTESIDETTQLPSTQQPFYPDFYSDKLETSHIRPVKGYPETLYQNAATFQTAPVYNSAVYVTEFVPAANLTNNAAAFGYNYNTVTTNIGSHYSPESRPNSGVYGAGQNFDQTANSRPVIDQYCNYTYSEPPSNTSSSSVQEHAASNNPSDETVYMTL